MTKGRYDDTMPGPLIAHGSGAVAEWLGVTPNNITNWLRRYDDVPEPDVVIVGGGGYENWGWLPTRRPEWERWHEALQGRARQAHRRRYT